MMKHYEITLSGRVQNVGFRHHAVQQARKYGIKGFVMNKPNGSVYIEAEGEEEDLDKFTQWCKQGPNWARVDNAFVNEAPLKHFRYFDVEFGNVY